MNKDVFWKKIPRSILFAIDGLGYVWRTQQNARFHSYIAAIVVMAGWLLRVSREDWLVLILTIGLVWSAEIINTSVEILVDYISPESHPVAKNIKDVSAASVLITAMISIVVGVIIFGPPLWGLLKSILIGITR